MKRKYIWTALIAALTISTLVWYGCTEKEEDILGSIYGTVTDYATGEPVGNVSIKLRPSGEATLTGNDGSYEFKDLSAGKYSLFLNKALYADHDDDYIIDLEKGKKVKRDIQIRKQMASLQITDMTGKPLDTLDFGSEESVKVKTFNVFNDGTESLTCTATYDCEWITNVSGLENTIQPGETKAVTVRIDRIALDDGENTTFLYITSNNGSNEIVVTATFLGAAAITTVEASNVTANSATVGGDITDDGGRPVTVRGICYGTSQTPTIDGDHTEDGSGSGSFSHNITGLSSSTTYYARAYATNRNGTYYASNIISFTTQDGLPTVTTSNVTNITATTAKGGGNVTNNGGYNVTSRGICWNTMGNPDLSDQHTTNGSGNGSFTSNMTGLTAGTTYYVRAYATNQHGTSYGNEHQFTASNGAVTITLSTASNITATSATCSANITNDGGSAVTERGICWSTSQYPTIAGNHTVVGSGTGSFSTSISNLSHSTTYYVRAYATNTVGTSYSNQINFTTNNGLPSVTTNTVSNITANSAVCGGNVTSDGGFPVTNKGICWSTSQYPTISCSHTSSGSGTGAFNASMSGLSANTTYYVRAYATNSIGTVYGTQHNFTTNSGLPTVSTVTATGSGASVFSGGIVSDDGGYPITDRGICYSNYPNPNLTTAYAYTSDGTGTGYYTSLIDSIITGTVYVRAYATNVNGTSYGNQIIVNMDYMRLPTFVHNGYIYRVAPEAIGTEVSWNAAISYCSSSTLYGYSDWRLPTLNELQTMCTNKLTIGGFRTGCNATSWGCAYWSSTTTGSGNIYYINSL